MQNDYEKLIVLPCHKHVRCDNVKFSFKCYYPNCYDMSSAPFESRFIQENSFNPAHLLVASYPVEWQIAPGCQPLRPNPLDCVRLHIRALWTRAPTVFQCCNVVQVPSKSKTLPDAGVLWAFASPTSLNEMLCFGALIYAASVRPQAFLHKPVASLHTEAKARVCLCVPTLSSVLHASGGCTAGLRSLREERHAGKAEIVSRVAAEMLFIFWWPCVSFV